MVEHKRRYHNSWTKLSYQSKMELHSPKPAHADFLAEGMAAYLCQTDFTTSNIHKL